MHEIGIKHLRKQLNLPACFVTEAENTERPSLGEKANWWDSSSTKANLKRPKNTDTHRIRQCTIQLCETQIVRV